MNRYAEQGIVTDAQEHGRTVTVLCDTHVGAGGTFRRMRELVSEVELERVTRANGQQELRFRSGGRILLRSLRASHGTTGEGTTVYLDCWYSMTTPDQHMVLADLAARGCEVIRP